MENSLLKWYGLLYPFHNYNLIISCNTGLTKNFILPIFVQPRLFRLKTLQFVKGLVLISKWDFNGVVATESLPNGVLACSIVLRNWCALHVRVLYELCLYVLDVIGVLKICGMFAWCVWPQSTCKLWIMLN